MTETKKLIKKVKKMDLGNPIITALVGLVVFYIGLKMFSGGMKSMGNLDHLSFFIHNPYWMFLGGIIMTLLWQSSSLSTTAIIAYGWLGYLYQMECLREIHYVLQWRTQE